MPSGAFKLDPSRTTLIRRQYMAEMKRRMAALERDIMELVGELDIFGLAPDVGAFNAETMPVTAHVGAGRATPRGSARSGKGAMLPCVNGHGLQGAGIGNYSDDQPRDEQGRWSDGGGGGGSPKLSKAAESAIDLLAETRAAALFGGDDEIGEGFAIGVTKAVLMSNPSATDKQIKVAVQSVSSYVGNSTDLNNTLRGLGRGIGMKQAEKEAAAIKAVVKSFPQNEAGSTVYRGLDPGVIDGLKPGDVYADRGFMSTSKVASVSREFGRDQLVLKDTRGLGRQLPEFFGSGELKEVLFPPGTRIRVTKTSRVKGRSVVHGVIE